MKRGVAALGALALLSTMSAGAEAKTTITLLTPLWNHNLQAWLEQTLVPDFERSHPGYTVNLQLASWGNWEDKLDVAWAAGTAPDIFMVPAEYTPMFAANGMALPLDAYVKSWNQEKDYIPAVWQSDTWRGHVYSLPLTITARTLILRADTARSAGLDPAAPPATWEQLATWAKRLTKIQGDKVEQAGWFKPFSQSFMDFVVQNGGSVLSPDGSQATIDGQPAVDALSWWIGLYNDVTAGLSAPSGGGLGPLVNGSVPIAYTEPTGLNSYFSKGFDPKDVEIVPPPGHPKQATGVHVARFAVSAQSKHPDAAWDFLALLEEPQNLMAFDAALSRIPPRLSLLQSDAVRNNPVYYKIGMIATQYGWPYVSVNANWQAMQTDLDKALTDTVAGKLAPKAALTQVAQEWSTELANGAKGTK